MRTYIFVDIDISIVQHLYLNLLKKSNCLAFVHPLFYARWLNRTMTHAILKTGFFIGTSGMYSNKGANKHQHHLQPQIVKQ